ncbi:dentin sialophosphoprotein isoform X2 [Venturia canescens]|uniref:dentin sialophosphoprotein isoform X2 n=1 Tax=Venturia canescens TaxID=32260 RepID=UPI001C9CC052|nr:dentin sialophosphoprotein isoform X2 [Venturia canescens]
MDFHIRNNQFEVKSTKKYDLSLKRTKQVTLSSTNGTERNSRKQTAPKDTYSEKESLDLSESQNIELRVSDSFLVENTQENVRRNLDQKDAKEQEIIVISDSSDEDISSNHGWRKEEQGESPAVRSISKVSLPNSEQNIPKNNWGWWQSEKTPDNVTLRNPIRKCSMYTSDETASERDFQNITNDENSPKTPLSMEGKIIPDSDESIFSHNRVRSILTENQCNIETLSSLDISEKHSPKESPVRNDYRKNFITRDKENCSTNCDNTKKAVDDRRKIPNFSKKFTNQSGSLKELNEIDRRVEEWRSTPDFTTNSRSETGSSKRLNEIDRKIEKWRKTPDYSTITRNETGSPSKLKETNKRNDDFQRTPEFSKSPKNYATSSSYSKEIAKRYETSKILQEESQHSGNVKEGNKIFERCENSGGSLKNLGKATEKTPDVRKTPISAQALSKRDARKILRIIESKRAIYQSPREFKKVSSSEESDSEDSFQVEKQEDFQKGNAAKVISETESESGEKVIRGSKVDLSKPYKTHVTRFLDPSLDSPDGMSERKKREIAHWLLTNSADTRSETSLSNIPPSDQNSPSSGNSSLERLEMNYETPNNRDKLRKPRTNETPKVKHKSQCDSAKSCQNDRLGTAKPRQIPIDTYFKKNNEGIKMLTPVSTKKKTMHNEKSTDNLEIEDCVDILDNLYGKTWRAKAHEILPTSEPRKKNIPLRDKAVQTERKPRSKKVMNSANSSSPEDSFHKFVKNLKPNLNSTRKAETKTKDRRKCTFINDSSSESGSSPKSSGETTYLTALTNPQIQNERKIDNRPAPGALHIRRAIAICDSDTSDESDNQKDNRKVLSFSDDENYSSSSDDNFPSILPKTSKIVMKSRKFPVSVSNTKLTKTKRTFLESLSAKIPLTEAHPEAKKYRQDYKNTKEELCKYLYKMYNDKIFDNKLPSDMSIEWNVRMRGTAGFCYNKRSIKALGGIVRSSRIVLATKILDTPDRLRDTLVHEMCHAAAWLINDVSDGHGPFWKAWASKAMKSFPELPEIKRCHDYKVTTKFTYRCTGCGYSVGRHSKSLDVEKKRCGHCYGKFELLINKITKSGKVETKTPVSKKPTGFALFVKENYSSVKKDLKGPHKEALD